MRTWAEWDDAVPGFVEIDLVGHEGGNSKGEFCFTLTITDISTGWTETRSVRNKLLRWCEQEELTFTRSRSGNKNDGAHVEQKNWHVVRQTVGYHRYDTPAELKLLNRIWALQGQLTNHFGPQQKLVKKIRTGAKISKKYDRPATPYQRVLADEGTVRARREGEVEAGEQALEPRCNPTSGSSPLR